MPMEMRRECRYVSRCGKQECDGPEELGGMLLGTKLPAAKNDSSPKKIDGFLHLAAPVNPVCERISRLKGCVTSSAIESGTYLQSEWTMPTWIVSAVPRSSAAA